METSDPKKASFGQGLELANILNKAIANAVKKTGASSDDVQKIIGKPDVIYKCIENLFLDVVVKNPSILKLISAGEKIMVEALNGKELISKAKMIFTSYIDTEFTHLKLNEASVATPETFLDVYEIVNTATYAQIFTELNSNLNKLVMTQEQIICFCKKHSKWLRQEQCGTYFLIKVNNEYFLVSVHIISGLRVYVYCFKKNDLCPAGGRHRFVVPQFKS